MRAPSILAGAVVALAAAAAPAQAGEVFVWDVDGYYSVSYAGLPGETNRVVARYDAAAGTYTLTDTGAVAMVPHVASLSGVRTTTVEGCTFERRRVVCRHDGPRAEPSFAMRLEGGDDSASLTTPPSAAATLVGGPGHDTILHTGGPATIVGAEGDDDLRGGAGDDVVFGGPGADRVDGGAGHDVTTYDSFYLNGRYDEWPGLSATAGVHVTLDGVDGDGMPGEGDNILPTIEEIDTTDFDDVVVGNGDPQTISTFGGDDRVVGGGGSDRLLASAGDDVIDAADGVADTFYCGEGADRLIADELDLAEMWPTDTCEEVEVKP